MKGKVISIIICLTLVATVTSRHQEAKKKSDFKSQDVPAVITQLKVTKTNSPKSDFFEKKEHNGGKPRTRRDAMMVLEIRETNEEISGNGKLKSTAKPMTQPTAKIGHYFINLGKHKGMSLEYKRAQQQMAEIYEGSGTTDPTPEGSGETETSYTVAVSQTPISLTTQSSIISTPSKCQNGGTYNGINCICPSNFYGPFCEFITDLNLGKDFETIVKVTLKIINQEYTEALNDKTSAEYDIFESNFKTEMYKVYGNVTGYKGVQIGTVSRGSIVVEHNVTVKTEYKINTSVIEDYDEIFRDVNTVLKKLVMENCTGQENSSLCVEASFTTEEVYPTSLEDQCKNGIPEDYLSFFSPLVTDKGLTCVSECNELSPRYMNCARGTCQIQSSKGTHCLCPDANEYLYTSARCATRISKPAIYGSTGAVAAVLLIIIITVVIILNREKRHKKRSTREPFSNDKEYKWYEDDEQWSTKNESIPATNLALQGEGDIPQNRYHANKETFKPSLENVDTMVQLKIMRPEINKPL
ncbi:hypothetical protein XELAEV_18019164mg [Xenopus laevis]|uniref:SEA domain-containing protein n=1 Tax=Xenopus laevis TaxID=8355 RepID=A0A974DEF0_XENLA|nr:hypothetical protein XELAEV_18019164mg [Xenopus laevis]